ncbi:hypothetical protein, conserved [Trypanosoma brucei gambiense DAL972]|uniref:CID domain-containing protein n=1 Tax=Trypanosoma brucei gambiense (strain MHOM/CI/86/DAL972) TaxID=679716 RepID=D0A1I3_TRYB9|nr:hypothetical protein, conserved [Trypanosoma brucei gambiense DAL972]CBH15125.1 hypothetical protein, conserved [Trypanosoma brucei gambiense DAL972]|eukprot:XP_011777391.1 hypothetical protein, conserved [Trypanosoma brucei gambiense DAL972]
MDTFQEKLDALQKQSKEQIAAAIAAMKGACRGGAEPVRVAVAIGSRLTPLNILSSFPVVCLLDAMVMAKGDETVAQVMKEFWRISPSLFVNYATTDEGLRDKVVRVVQRWGSKKLIEPPMCEKLLGAIKGIRPDEASSAEEGKGEKRSDEAQNGRKGAVFTRSEVSGFCAILHSCTKMIEKLPPHRASMYMEVAQKEMSSHVPNRPALLFFQGLHAELGKELTLYNSNAVKNEHQLAQAVSGGPSAKEALGNLLDKLSKDHASPSLEAGDGKGHAFHVVRYITPLQSDICQRLSLARRAGFGDWYRRPKNEYHYPKRESNARKVFRAPAGAGPLVRTWFPSEQQWISENNMASLGLFRERDPDKERESSSLYAVARKRDRDC